MRNVFRKCRHCKNILNIKFPQAVPSNLHTLQIQLNKSRSFDSLSTPGHLLKKESLKLYLKYSLSYYSWNWRVYMLSNLKIIIG